MSNYVRAKRGNQTVFLYCDPNETIKQLQTKLSEIVSCKPDDIRLVLESKSLDEARTASDYKLENDSVVSFVFRKGDKWEEAKE